MQEIARFARNACLKQSETTRCESDRLYRTLNSLQLWPGGALQRSAQRRRPGHAKLFQDGASSSFASRAFAILRIRLCGSFMFSLRIKSTMSWKGTSRTLGLAAAGIGAVAFAGWVFGIDALKRIHPAWVAMKPNTALCLILAGLAVVLLRDENVSGSRRRLGMACGFIVAMLGFWASGRIHRLVETKHRRSALPRIGGRSRRIFPWPHGSGVDGEFRPNWAGRAAA